MVNDPPTREHIDALGKSIAEGRDLATYLWQVPGDAASLERVIVLLQHIQDESRSQGRREMPRICEDLLRAAKASPSPQQMDILQDGFDRMHSLWGAARSGML